MGINRRTILATFALGVAAVAALAIPPVRRRFHPLVVRLRGSHIVQQRLHQFTSARARVQSHFDRAGALFPPARVVLLGLKDERRLGVYAGPRDGALGRVADYPILAASGNLGPKLREGDRQVPEGVYPLESLNPDSRFHVALRVGYPNAFDREAAKRDGRPNLGGDIMIHGGSASVGCLAMGDPAAEDLFVLAAMTGIENVTVVLSPVDLRRRALPPLLDDEGNARRYDDVKARIAQLPD